MALLSSRQRMGAAAIILAASALLSRLMGLIRDKIISWQFGATHEADMYFAAFVTPDIINYLLAGGFMSITIIPILGRLFQQDEAEAWKFFSCVTCWMACGAILLTLGSEIWARQLAIVTAPGFTPEQIERLAFFTRIILPAQVFFLAGAPFTALLFLRRQFSAPALSPLLYNGCIILFGVTLPYLPQAGAHFGMTGYCIGVTIGAFLGAFLLPLSVARRGGINFQLIWTHPQLKKFFIIALPLMLGQTVVMLDEQFLRVFGSMIGEGSVSILNYARRIAQTPISLVGQAAAVASYPFLVKLLAEDNLTKFNETLNTALKTSLLLIIPCSLWMIASALPILSAIFEGGRFGALETMLASAPTRLMLAAAPIWIFYMVLARAFYAWEDSLTPAITGTIITIICIPVYYFTAVPLGINAVAGVSGLALTAYLLWLGLIWKRRHTSAAFCGLFSLTLRSLAASAPAALAAWFIITSLHIDWFDNLPFFNHCLNMAISGFVFGVVFLPLAAFAQPELIKKLKEMIKARRKKQDKNEF